MRKLRFSAIILALVLFTGCTTDEVAYLEMSKNAIVMYGASIDGNYKMKINIAEIDSSSFYGANLFIGGGYEQSPLYEMFKNLSIDYSVQYVKSKGIAQGKFINSATGDTMFAFVLKDKKFYADVTYILGVMNEFLTSDYENAYNIHDAIKKEAIEKNLDGIKYITIDMDDVNKLYAVGYESDRKVIEDILSLNIFKQTGEAQAAFIDNVLLGAFKDFEGDIVTYKDGIYSIKLDTKKSLALIESILIYLIDNAEATAVAVEKVIDVYPSYYGEDAGEMLKEEMRTGVNQLADNVVENAVLYKDTVKTYLNNENVGIAAILAFFDGSSFETILKDEEGSLSRSENMTVNVKAGIFTPETSTIEISNKHSIKSITDIEIVLPDIKEARSVSELKDTIKYPKAMVIWSPYYYYEPLFSEETTVHINEETADSAVESADDSSVTGSLYNNKIAEDLQTPIHVDAICYNPFGMNYIDTATITISEEKYLEVTGISNFFEDSLNDYAANNSNTDVRFITIENTQYININDLAKIGYEVNFDNNAVIIIKR